MKRVAPNFVRTPTGDILYVGRASNRVASKAVMKEPTHSIALLRAVRARRLATNQTAREMGRRTGFGPDLISKWEHGHVMPTIMNFEALVHALGGRLEIEWEEVCDD